MYVLLRHRHRGQTNLDNPLACLANGGRLVAFVTAIDETVKINLASLFLDWQRVIGTTMGSRAEFQDMPAFVEAHRIRAVIDRAFPLSDGAQAARLSRGGGRTSLAIRMHDIASLSVRLCCGVLDSAHCLAWSVRCQAMFGRPRISCRENVF